ncbi:MAG TPA: hypothetical protein VLH58_02815, partial [Candidatus Methylomirabilis sp.]|nr:hypothetical protein [Candidatus Methylomirabilis sp.]
MVRWWLKMGSPLTYRSFPMESGRRTKPVLVYASSIPPKDEQVLPQPTKNTGRNTFQNKQDPQDGLEILLSVVP